MKLVGYVLRAASGQPSMFVASTRGGAITSQSHIRRSSKPTPFAAERVMTTLVAHSLACALVVLLPARRPDVVVGGALLVGPADVDDRTRTPPVVEGFAPLPLAPLPFPSIVVGSSDDPFMSIGRAMLFARGAQSSCISGRAATSTWTVASVHGPTESASRGASNSMIAGVARIFTWFRRLIDSPSSRNLGRSGGTQPRLTGYGYYV